MSFVKVTFENTSFCRVVEIEKVFEICDKFVLENPNVGVPHINPCDESGNDLPEPQIDIDEPRPTESVDAPVISDYKEKEFSTFTNLVVDDVAKVRIEAIHARLADLGHKVDTSEQYFATGTRMAKEGYAVQLRRKAEHDAMGDAQEVLNAFREEVVAEKRVDKTMKARDLAQSLSIRGNTIVAFDHVLSTQAIEGLILRLDSPSRSYVLGLRERAIEEFSKPDEERNLSFIENDLEKILDILKFECNRYADENIRLRMREGVGDIFAVVSPSYGVADSHLVMKDLLRNLPENTKASVAYNQSSTSWEVRALTFTSTPVEEQAVGEPFEAFVSLRSRDNGTGRFWSGGGINILRCLNASVYTAGETRSSRVHRGNRVMGDIKDMLATATRSLGILINSFEKAREEEIVWNEEKLTLEQAIPGIYRSLFEPRRELATVLTGKKEQHIEGLYQAYRVERRDYERTTRADIVQGLTKYLQTLPSEMRRNTEIAAGKLTVSTKKIVPVFKTVDEDA